MATCSAQQQSACGAGNECRRPAVSQERGYSHEWRAQTRRNEAADATAHAIVSRTTGKRASLSNRGWQAKLQRTNNHRQRKRSHCSRNSFSCACTVAVSIFLLVISREFSCCISKVSVAFQLMVAIRHLATPLGVDWKLLLTTTVVIVLWTPKVMPSTLAS